MDPSVPESVHRTFFHITRLHFTRLFKLLEPLGIHPGQPPLLHALERQGEMSQKELAAILHNRAATITVMLQRMEQNGWISRMPDPHDQRVIRVSLTEEGRRIAAQTKAIMDRLQQECFGSLSEEERGTLQQLLNRVLENLQQIDERME